ncbi:MAG: hypothetical protein KatS3mg110_1399 [Pirellulaceae bacterium]|nr:MAG: hypothetical protein KatS3mg110_1399 [Pirellulaceae bacterium]
MTQRERLYRQQILREAEGYVELLQLAEDRGVLSDDLRDRLAQRALKRLRQTRFVGRLLSRALLLEGQALRLMGRYREAIGPLTRSAELDSENIHVWLALGWCYKRLGRLDLAIESLEQAMPVGNDEAIVHYNLACYWSLAGNRDLALRYLSQALSLDPRYRDLVDDEPDFNPIRHDPEFQSIVALGV